MTSDTKVRNPLTKNTLVVRSEINELVDSARLDVLRAVQTSPEPASQTPIASNAELSRQATSNHLAVLRDRGFVNSHGGGTELTGGGKLLLDAIESYLEDAERCELAFQTRSEHAVSILRALERHPCNEEQLQTTSETGPSKRTVRRVLNTFQEYGWCEYDGCRYTISTAGKKVAERYETLEESVSNLIRKAPWIQRLPIEAATVPITALSDASLYISNPYRPWKVLSTAIKLFDRNTARFRALCSVYNPLLFHAYRANLELGVECEAILDFPTYVDALDSSGTLFAIQSEKYRNYRPLVVERALTLGIGIYDKRKVAIGAYNERGEGKHIAMIVSTNDRLVNWGMDLYRSYLSEATHVNELTRSTRQ